MAGYPGPRRVPGAVGRVAGGLRAERPGAPRAPARVRQPRQKTAARLVLLLLAGHQGAHPQVRSCSRSIVCKPFLCHFHTFNIFLRHLFMVGILDIDNLFRLQLETCKILKIN